MKNFLVSRADWSSDSRVYWPAPAHLWNGVVDGERFGTGVTVLFYSTEEVGKGPKWHVHTYDEIFILQAGCAQFTVGDRKFEAKEGDIVFGPANVPHKFINIGPGVLKTIDISGRGHRAKPRSKSAPTPTGARHRESSTHLRTPVIATHA